MNLQTSWVKTLRAWFMSLDPFADNDDDENFASYERVPGVNKSSSKAQSKSEKTYPKPPLVFWDTDYKDWFVKSMVEKQATTAMYTQFTKNYLSEPHRETAYAGFARCGFCRQVRKSYCLHQERQCIDLQARRR